MYNCFLSHKPGFEVYNLFLPHPRAHSAHTALAYLLRNVNLDNLNVVNYATTTVITCNWLRLPCVPGHDLSALVTQREGSQQVIQLRKMDIVFHDIVLNHVKSGQSGWPKFRLKAGGAKKVDGGRGLHFYRPLTKFGAR